MSSHVFGRQASAVPPRALTGDGCYIVDADGKRYLDGSGGPAVSCLGHSDAMVRAAMHDQIDRVTFAHSSFFTTDPVEQVADRLAALAPEGLTRVYFTSGGSEAVEAALKLARAWANDRGEPTRHRVIARRQSYHGCTLGALSASGNAARRAPYLPLLLDWSHIAPCYEYRDRLPGEAPEVYGRRVADELEAEILRLGPETVMAFIAEPVVGATLGAVPAVPGYLARIREICTRYGVAMILDEVMCGIGRTGHLFACAEDGVIPDMICIAKGLGGGYAPIGAVLVQDHIHRTIMEGTGYFQHGHTYMEHPLSAAAAAAVLSRLVDDGILARVAPLGRMLQAALIDRFGQHPHIGDIRGRGLFLGLEFVADRETKAPYPPDRLIAAGIRQAAFEAGLICYPMGGLIDGTNGDHVIVAPPFIAEEAQITELVDKLAIAIRAVTGH